MGYNHRVGTELEAFERRPTTIPQGRHGCRRWRRNRHNVGNSEGGKAVAKEISVGPRQ